MAGLTTHVLDLEKGTPAAGLRIVLKDEAGAVLAEAFTDADGRCDGPLLGAESVKAGRYLLEFHAGDYLRRSPRPLPDPLFLDVVPIAFGIADVTAHYHVPLLLSPYGYSTYRGS